MRNLVFLATGYLVALFISMEVMRVWRDGARAKESFAANPEVRRELEKAEIAVDHAEIRVNSSTERVEDTQILERDRQELGDRQDEVQQRFAELARKELDQIRDAVEVKDGETEYKLQEINRKIEAVKNSKVSKTDMRSLVAEITAEIEGLKRLADVTNGAFQTAMNTALDAEDVQQYQLIKDIQAAYATKAENAELESEINRVTALARETDTKVDARAKEIMSDIEDLKKISDTIQAFEERNMLTPEGGVVDSRFVDSLQRIQDETVQRINEIEKAADSLKRCSEQAGLRDRVVDMEKDIRDSARKCDEARSVCDRALGSDTIVMKPGEHVQLGESGRSLVMQGNALQVCDTPGRDGVNANCVNLVASINR